MRMGPMSRSRPILIFCILAFFVLAVSSSKKESSTDISISHLTLLLPHTINSKNEVRFKLDALNGCFKWFSSNPEIVQVEPIYATNAEASSESAQCANSAYVTPVTQGQSVVRSSSWIMAEDLVSRRFLRCEVFVDWIVDISITTTTRTISKDDIERLDIAAFDSEGNLFSSVQGLEFQWNILSNEATVGKVLKFVPFKDANIEIDQQLLDMELKGTETGTVLIQGINIGRTEVSARLIEPGYSAIGPAVVSLSVLEPLQLKPAYGVYLIPGTQLQYELQTFNREFTSKISLPNPQYIWSTKHNEIATVSNAGLLTAHALGTTELDVQYASMTDNWVRSSVYVVLPAYLALKIFPVSNETSAKAQFTSNWNLINGHHYELFVEAYNREGHLIYNSDNLKFEVDLPLTHFTVQKSSPNRSYFLLSTIKVGVCEVKASIEATRYLVLEKPVVIRQEAVIAHPVKITPGQVLLPFISQPKSKHQLNLKATGGSDDYNWHSSNTSVFSINAFGVLSVQGPGESTITASDKKNSLNRDSITARAKHPARIQFTPEIVEVQIGFPLYLPVAVWDQEDNLFDNCSAIPFVWEVKDPSVFSLLSSEASDSIKPTPTSCAVQTLLALKEGQSTVVVSLRELKAEITIFSFGPLQLLQPESRSALVSLGCSSTFMFSGGPAPWFFEPSTYFTDLQSSHPDKIRVEKVSPASSAVHSYVITCLKYGDQELTISAGNRPIPTHAQPATVSLTANFSCQPPHSLYLIPAEPEKLPESSIGCLEVLPSLEKLKERGASTFLSPYRIRNARQLGLNITVLDSQGRIFDNFTSVLFDWAITNTELLNFVTTEPYSRLVNVASKEGSSNITIDVKGYEPKILKAAGASLVPLSLSKSFEFILVPNIKLVPDHLAMINHHDNRIRLAVVDGSGYHRFSGNYSDYITLSKAEIGAAFVELAPLKDGIVEIRAEDLCLGGSDVAQSLVTISDVASLRTRVNDMVKLGDSITLHLEPLDVSGIQFLSDQLRFLSFSFHLDNRILRVSRNADNTFEIKGNQVGVGRITFETLTRSGKTISSKPAEIYVFPEFKIFPRKLVLLPGATFQIGWTGGPPLRNEVTYGIEDTTVGGIDPNGVVQGRDLGATIIKASIQSYDAITGEKILYGQDAIEVIVKKLNGIRIQISTGKLLVGNEITARVTGLNGESPFTYGSLNLAFRWESQDTEVVVLKPIYENSNVSIDDEAGFSVRLYAKSPGKTRVFVRLLSSLAGHDTTTLTATQTITVMDPLKILSPTSLLLAPNSKYLIRTNRPESKKLNFQVHSVKRDSDRVVTVNENGLVSTSGTPGVALVVVDEQDDSLQPAVVKVVVKPIHHLQILPSVPAHFNIPLGSFVEFHVNFRDDVGQLFDSTEGFGLQTQVSSLDVISVTKGNNGSLVVKALVPGDAILRVFLSDAEHLEDFISIRVGHMITPPNPIVHLGGEIRFSTSMVKTTKGGWSTENSKILSIDRNTGVAVANTLGKARVYFNSTIYTFTQVNIVKIGKITVDPGTVTRITSGQGATGEYKFKVSFFDETFGVKLDQSSALVDNKIQFECKILENKWAYALASRDQTTDSHWCTIVPLSPKETPVEQAISSLTLSITANDVARTYTYQTTASFKFQPGFFIRNKPDVVRLGTNSKSFLFDVYGKLDQVNSSDRRLRVDRLSNADANPQTFRAQVVDERKSFSNLPIELVNFETGQRDQILVSYSLEEAPVIISPVETIRTEDSKTNWLLGLVVALVLVVVAVIYQLRKQDRIIQTLSPPRKPLGALMSPPPVSFSPSPAPSSYGREPQPTTPRFEHSQTASPFKPFSRTPRF